MTPLNITCFKVFWCFKKILKQTPLVTCQFRNCSHKQCRAINDRKTRNVKSRLPSIPRDCNHPGVPTHISFPPPPKLDCSLLGLGPSPSALLTHEHKWLWSPFSTLVLVQALAACDQLGSFKGQTFSSCFQNDISTGEQLDALTAVPAAADQCHKLSCLSCPWSLVLLEPVMYSMNTPLGVHCFLETAKGPLMWHCSTVVSYTTVVYIVSPPFSPVPRCHTNKTVPGS